MSKSENSILTRLSAGLGKIIKVFTKASELSIIFGLYCLIEEINNVIKDTKAKGEKLKTLQEQKVKISEGANKRIEGAQELHEAAMNAIEKKYNKSDEDKKITDKYSQDVAKVTEEGQLKLV